MPFFESFFLDSSSISGDTYPGFREDAQRQLIGISRRWSMKVNRRPLETHSLEDEREGVLELVVGGH